MHSTMLQTQQLCRLPNQACTLQQGHTGSSFVPCATMQSMITRRRHPSVTAKCGSHFTACALIHRRPPQGSQRHGKGSGGSGGGIHAASSRSRKRYVSNTGAICTVSCVAPQEVQAVQPTLKRFLAQTLSARGYALYIEQHRGLVCVVVHLQYVRGCHTGGQAVLPRRGAGAASTQGKARHDI